MKWKEQKATMDEVKEMMQKISTPEHNGMFVPGCCRHRRGYGRGQVRAVRRDTSPA